MERALSRDICCSFWIEEPGSGKIHNESRIAASSSGDMLFIYLDRLFLDKNAINCGENWFPTKEKEAPFCAIPKVETEKKNCLCFPPIFFSWNFSTKEKLLTTGLNIQKVQIEERLLRIFTDFSFARNCVSAEYLRSPQEIFFLCSVRHSKFILFFLL